jgi:DNA-binding transcriptional LysR family regulator
MTLMQLRCFWTVGTTGSFTEASEILFIAQSSVSKSIAALEQEFSFPLFIRSGKTVTLSDGGKRLLEYCGEVIAMLNSFETEAENIRCCTSSDNRIRLTGVPTMAAYGVLSRISDFGRQNRDYDVIVEEEDEDRVLFLLQSGGCDVAFCSNIKLNEKNYNLLKICHEDFSVALSNNHELAGKAELKLSDLKGQKFIFSKQESMLYDLCYNACVEAGFCPNVVMRTSREDIAAQYIQNQRCCGMGLTSIFNTSHAEDQCIKHIADSPCFDYVLCWKKSNYASRALKSFIRFYKKSIEIAEMQGV